jgi:DNA topoisomerase-3
VVTEEVTLAALRTKPPARYTEATLLSAMEGAGKLIDDDELREAMAERAWARQPRARPSSKA